MIQSDYSIKLGEKIQITVSRNGSPVTYYAYVFKNELSGPLLIDQTFSCGGEADYEVNTGANLPSKTNTSSDSAKQNVILPSVTSTNMIPDGQNEDVITFEFNVAQENSNITFQTCMTFQVETTVDTTADPEEYNDCEVRARIRLDGENVAVLRETYGDGHHTLTLTHLFQDLTVGDHEITINLKVDGGKIG
jgi:hypothetical protein